MGFNTISNNSSTEAFRWTEGGGRQALGDLPGGTFRSVAYDVSADGNRVVGEGESSSGREAFLWTTTNGMAGLGSLSGGATTSSARGISSDGSIVVGYSGSDFGGTESGTEAFLWTEAGGMVGLGDLPGGATGSLASDISADGLTVVGTSGSDFGGTGSGNEAFLWTEVGGMMGLGDLAGGTMLSRASGVSGDGAIVVGSSSSYVGTEAFLWTAGTGMFSLRDYLIANGVAGIGGWNLYEANAISSDGSAVVGAGINPNGKYEAFLVRGLALNVIPEPSTLFSLCLGAGLFAYAARRRRRAGQ